MKTAGSNTLRMRVALTSVGKQLNALSWHQDLSITLAVTAANELATGICQNFAKPIDQDISVALAHIKPIHDHWDKMAGKSAKEKIK